MNHEHRDGNCCKRLNENKILCVKGKRKTCDNNVYKIRRKIKSGRGQRKSEDMK